MALEATTRYSGELSQNAVVEVIELQIENAIREKLQRILTPQALEVVNESHLHSGHASSPGTGESHFRVVVISDLFSGKSRLERHRMVNAALAEELAGSVHALAIKALTPEESLSTS